MLRHIRTLMLAKGYWSERAAPLADVIALIARLRPINPRSRSAGWAALRAAAISCLTT